MTNSKRSKEVCRTLGIDADQKINVKLVIVSAYIFFFFISDDTVALTVSVKTAASDANATVSNVKERLRNISEEVGRITLTNISVNINDMLTDADQAGKC